MVGCTKNEQQKKKEKLDLKDMYMVRAINIYWENCLLPKPSSESTFSGLVDMTLTGEPNIMQCT
jgi:hypothetical protein